PQAWTPSSTSPSHSGAGRDSTRRPALGRRSEIIDPDGLGAEVVSVLVDGVSDPELLEDLLLQLVGQVGIVVQEAARVLLALTQLVALVGVPSTGLADQPGLDAHVDEPTLAADALAVHDVELGLLE